MHIYKLLFTYCILILIGIFIFIIQTKFLLVLFIAIINRLLFYFIITLGCNRIGDEGAKALAEALKLNKNLTNINLSMLMRLFQHIITAI